MLPLCRATIKGILTLGLDVSVPQDIGIFDLAYDTLPSMIAGDWSFAATVTAIMQWAVALVMDGYERAPVPVLVLSAVLIVPLAALGSSLLTGVVYRIADRRRARIGASSNALPEEAPPWPSEAWLDIEGHQRSALPSRATLVRIGRHQDNEILIADTSVHRHHAIIQRTFDADYVITDMSGEGGNGVLINGERLAESRLFNGDIIQLGEAKMRFESALL